MFFNRVLFKVLLEKEELADVAQQGLDSYMVVEESKEKPEDKEIESRFFCPYCGQQAQGNNWWTESQLDYIRRIAENIMAGLINENLIRPLKKDFHKPISGLISISFEGKEIEQKELHIAPETDDMEIFDLPCCNRKIKIENNKEELVHCFFCGFPHKKQV
ncbi:MAG: hypothetical protein PHS12_02185 [Candidatus Omnitrophica bacterium]|jgi:hypothetical protein|nr:hypothetical protein [Candidatus Omnitrophota bacterium]